MQGALERAIDLFRGLADFGAAALGLLFLADV